MPNRATQTNDAPQQWRIRPCPVCQMQLRIQWTYTVHSLLNIWVLRFRGPRIRNKTLWVIVSVAAVVGLYCLSDEPYLCRIGGRICDRHLWGRAAAGGTGIVQSVISGARRLSAWFSEQWSSSRPADRMEGPDTQLDTDSDTQTDTEPGTPTNTEQDTPTDTEQDTDPDVWPDSEPDTRADTPPDSESDVWPDVWPGSEPDIQTDTEPGTQPDTPPDSEPDVWPDVTPEAEAEADSEADSEAEAEADAEDDYDFCELD